MGKFFKWLEEARRNPEKNPKINIIDALKPYKDDENVFVSFTDINKLGLYPLSSYATPLGIYSYPLKYIWNHIENNTVPFAGNRPYVQVFKSKGNVMDVKDYKQSHLQKDIEKIKKLYWNKNTMEIFKKYYKRTFSIVSDNFEDEKEIFNNFYYNVIEMLKKEAMEKTPFKQFWNITRQFANLISDDKNSNSKNMGYRSMVMWNDILRKLGYDGFSDKTGLGAIHVAEPTQAVFFSVKAIEQISMELNKRYFVPIKSSEQLIKLLQISKIKFSELVSLFKGKVVNTFVIYDVRFFIKEEVDEKFLLYIFQNSVTIKTILEMIFNMKDGNSFSANDDIWKIKIRMNFDKLRIPIIKLIINDFIFKGRLINRETILEQFEIIKHMLTGETQVKINKEMEDFFNSKEYKQLISMGKTE